jgi:hypothetical protein
MQQPTSSMGASNACGGKDPWSYNFLSITKGGFVFVPVQLDFEEVKKLGQGFSLADPLEEIDIGDGITPSPTFINKNISLEHKYAIIKLLKEYVDYVA